MEEAKKNKRINISSILEEGESKIKVLSNSLIKNVILFIF